MKLPLERPSVRAISSCSTAAFFSPARIRNRSIDHAHLRIVGSETEGAVEPALGRVADAEGVCCLFPDCEVHHRLQRPRMVRKRAQRVVDIRPGSVLARAAYQELVLPGEVRAFDEVLLLDGRGPVVVRAVLSGRPQRTASLLVESRLRQLTRPCLRGTGGSGPRGQEHSRRKLIIGFENWSEFMDMAMFRTISARCGARPFYRCIDLDRPRKFEYCTIHACNPFALRDTASPLPGDDR